MTSESRSNCDLRSGPLLVPSEPGHTLEPAGHKTELIHTNTEYFKYEIFSNLSTIKTTVNTQVLF